MGYIGGAFAFVSSVVGAFMNAGQTIYWVEDGIDSWLKSYGTGKYDDYIEDPESEESAAMEMFMTRTTLEMTFFVVASFFHDMFLMGIGYVSALTIFLKMCTWSGETNTLPLRYGWKTMLFGVLMGTVTYLAGSITKSSMKYVMLMIGFSEHSTTSDSNHKTWITTEKDN